MLQCTQQGDALTVHLCGEIDHCAAEGLRNEIEMQIVRQNAKRLILDFSQVTFMDRLSGDIKPCMRAAAA